jgi:hypothetical protein
LITLRLHRAVYRGTSIDEAVKVFSGHAAFRLTEEPSDWVVAVTAEKPERERRIAGEFGNYALGLTIQAGGPDAGEAPR